VHEDGEGVERRVVTGVWVCGGRGKRGSGSLRDRYSLLQPPGWIGALLSQRQDVNVGKHRLSSLIPARASESTGSPQDRESSQAHIRRSPHSGTAAASQGQ
jgi:hypothetical protein